MGPADPRRWPFDHAGLRDRTDYHWGDMAKAALLSTLLGVGAELGSGDDDDLVRALRSGTQNSVNQTGYGGLGSTARFRARERRDEASVISGGDCIAQLSDVERHHLPRFNIAI